MQPRWKVLLFLLLALALVALAGSALAQTDGKGSSVTSGGASLTGVLSVVWGDPQPGVGGAAQTVYYLLDDTGNQLRVEIDDAALAAAGGVRAVSGRRVTVSGTALPAAPGSDAAPRLRAESITLAPGQPSSPEPITGSQPYVSIMCKFSDISATPKGLAYFKNMYSNSYPGLDHYWRQTSFNNVNVVGSDAFGWFTLPYPRSHYFDANGNLLHWDILTDCTAVADSAVYFPSFTGINMMFNEVLDCCAWGGTGWTLTLDGVSKPYGITWEPPWGYSEITVMAHEMGHSMGMPHSSGAYGLVYDNRWDVMSDTWSDCNRATHATYGCVGQGTISFHKDLVGWVAAARRFVLGASPQTITLERLALPGASNYLMAVLPINGSSSHYYTVEARKWSGYDQKLPLEGVVIHEVDNSYAYVVDVDNNGDTGDAGAQWLPGETFYGQDGITVEIVSATSTGYTVTVAPGANVTDPHEPNNSRGTATRVFYGTILSDPLIDPAGDVDVYRFVGDAGETVVVDIDASALGSQLDPYIELLASDGTVIASNDDYDGLDSYLTYPLTASGNYYVKIREYNHPNEGGSSYFYTLKLDEGASAAQMDVLVTTAGVGTTSDGLTFEKRDILHWNTPANFWSLFLDGSAIGLPAKADIVAFDTPNGDFPAANMAFAANVVIPGVGTIAAHDLLLYDASGFHQRFDGSDVGLSTTGEKLDAVDIMPGNMSPIGANCIRYVIFSTKGSGSVKDVNNAKLTFAGEDVLGFCATQLGPTTAGKWHKLIDGSNEGMPAGATFSLSTSEDGGQVYLTTTGPFNVDGVSGSHSMIYVFDLGTRSFSGPIWSAADVGLPVKVDGLEAYPAP